MVWGNLAEISEGKSWVKPSMGRFSGVSKVRNFLGFLVSLIQFQWRDFSLIYFCFYRGDILLHASYVCI